MTNFWARTITGLSMVFVLLALMALNYWLLVLAFFIVAILCLWEFFTLFTSQNIHPQRLYGTIAGGLLYLSIAVIPPFASTLLFPPPVYIPVLLCIPLCLLPFILEVFRKKENPAINIALTMTGILYISAPLAMLNLLNGTAAYRVWHFPVLLTGFFLITWIYDTGAYLYGKQFGKHKFFERISPKKTWEGIIAGVIVAFMAAIGLYLLSPGILLIDWLVIAFLIIVFGTLGDLVESLFKRSLNIKDSGSILPGHGGILDRFDTIFLSVPFVILYLFIRNLI